MTPTAILHAPVLQRGVHGDPASMFDVHDPDDVLADGVTWPWQRTSVGKRTVICGWS